MSIFEELKRRNVIRVAVAYLAGSWFLIQVLETLFPIFGLPETSIRVLVIALGILFVPAIVVAWIYEFTPDGLQPDSGAAIKTGGSVNERKALDRTIIVMLTLSVAYFAIDKFILDPARDEIEIKAAADQAATDALLGAYGDNSIAVLPFVNMSADPDQEYFSDGMAEEVLNLLAKIRELRVISRSSAFAFKGKDISIPEIGEKLRAAHILEGSVRTSGNRVRVTAQLIDARTDTHLWSDTYDGDLDDVFAIQDEISAKVVAQLKISILGDLPSAEEIDTEAYSLFLRGRQIVHTGQWDNLALAERLLIRALEIEPNYVPAMTALARAYLVAPATDERTADDLRQMVRDLSARITAVVPDSAIDFGWRAWITQSFDHDLATAAPLYERALALKPRDVNFLRPAAGFLMDIGYTDESLAVYKYVVQRDPGCVNCLAGLSATMRYAGKFDDAVTILEEAVAWAPDRRMIHWALGSALLQAGRPAEALSAFDLEKVEEMGQLGRIMALHDLDRLAEFDEAFASFRAEQADSVEGIARIAAWTGDNDLALEMMREIVAENGAGILTDVLSGGFYVKLMEDARFDAMLREHGQHPDEREKIPFKFTPPE